MRKMGWMQQAWVGSTIVLFLAVLFLTGCPKRPEVVETIPKPMTPPREVGMPVPSSAPKAAILEEKIPTGVTVQAPDAEPIPEASVIPEAGITEEEVRPETSAGVTTSEPSTAVTAPELVLKDIYFDFDRSAVRENSKKLLDENVEWFKNNPMAKVIIEGHCDERGSSEYNLALGERRAKAARDYLVAAGIEASRISTISFGKERPFVLGHDESAWKWNRRAHFILSAK